MDENTLKQIAQQLKKPEGDAGIQEGGKMNIGNEFINRLAIEQLGLSPMDKILEIGMGNGFFVKDILADETIRYTGCDYSEIMIEEARKKNKEFIEKEQAEFFLCSANQLPFPENTFNKVLTVNTIYFWDNLEKELSEIRRVLQPEGKMIIGLRPKSNMQHYPFVKYGFNMFNKEEVSEILSKNGFKINAVIEKQEAEQEFFGKKVKVESLIICAQRI